MLSRASISVQAGLENGYGRLFLGQLDEIGGEYLKLVRGEVVNRHEGVRGFGGRIPNFIAQALFGRRERRCRRHRGGLACEGPGLTRVCLAGCPPVSLAYPYGSAVRGGH